MWLRFFLSRRQGKDSYGNTYHESFLKNKNGLAYRWVRYKNHIEASMVPAAWHGWLHHTHQATPKEQPLMSWYKPHQPNQTMRHSAISPVPCCHPTGDLTQSPSNYQPWHPPEKKIR